MKKIREVEYYTIIEVSEMLQVSISTIQRKAKDLGLPRRQLGHFRYYTMSEIERIGMLEPAGGISGPSDGLSSGKTDKYPEDIK